MSIPAVNLTYVGAGPNANGQIVADQTSGPKSKELVGYGTATLDGSATTFSVNFIDGVQKLAQYSIVLPAQAVAAPATINGTANQVIVTVNSGPGQPNSVGQIAKGTSVTFAGFTNSGNNGSFTVNAVGPNFVQITNASGVAETNFAATLTYTSGAAVAAVSVTRSGNASDTAAISTTVQPSALSNTGFTATISAAGSNAQLLSFVVEIYLAS